MGNIPIKPLILLELIYKIYIWKELFHLWQNLWSKEYPDVSYSIIKLINIKHDQEI